MHIDSFQQNLNIVLGETDHVLKEFNFILEEVMLDVESFLKVRSWDQELTLRAGDGAY